MRAALGLAGLLLLVLPAGVPPGEAAAVTVRMTDGLAFDPPMVRIRAGQSVEWRNDSTLTHTSTNDPGLAEDPRDAQLPPGAEPWDSGFLRPGETFTHTFPVPGVYRYFCKPHERMGMVGAIVVE